MAAAKEMRHWNPGAQIGDDGYVLADVKAAVAEATAGTTAEQEMRRRGANAPRPGQRGANAPRPGQRGANAPRPGQRGANAPRPAHRGANARRPGHIFTWRCRISASPTRISAQGALISGREARTAACADISPQRRVAVSRVQRSTWRARGMALVKEVMEAANPRKEKDAGKQGKGEGGGSHEQLYYVKTCFASISMMANFADNLLKKGGSEKLSDDEIELTLDKSASEDHERSILCKLKEQCGAQFTSKMEGMVKDLRLARENAQDFDDWRSRHPKDLNIELTVTVLTTGFWPTYKAMELALPEEMVCGVEQFKEFYEATTKHRKLTWIYALGNCHIKGNFKAKPIELVLSTFQAAPVLLFNQEETMTYGDIKERLNLPEEDITRLLHSLSCAKYAVLLKSPMNKSIGKEDSFTFNYAFTDRMRRIKISLPVQDEKKKVIEDVDKDRRYSIDAAIVRTMKSRKQLQHQQTGFLSRMMPPSEMDPFLEAVDAANISAAFSLLGLDACDQSTPHTEAAIVQMSMPADFGGLNLALLQSEAPAAFYSAQSIVLPKLVVQQLSRMFKPDFKLIKKRIEDLISRDYMERDADSSNLYRYVA
eukprot:jgi/Tetstr1/454842/TSEL_000320.t1